MAVTTHVQPVSDAVRAKADGYLTGGHITVVQAGPDQIVASVDARTGRWRVDLTAHGWRCTCPAWKTCAHIVAVRLIAGHRSD